ncbi:MAG: hypothetical protein KC483_06805 [Nitrosarchaeum sp.]|nr:hypothetical protein [Nitrosarchaeum sp.]MCA9819887.1 hypothetical protein [Nitrosarchaeum sp.]
MDYNNLCGDVLDSNSQIRFAGVLSSRGDLIAQKSRDDDQLLTDEEVKMSVHYTFERWNRLQNLEHRLGKEKATITEYENVTMVSLLLENNLVLVSIEPNANYPEIISKIRAIIRP